MKHTPTPWRQRNDTDPRTYIETKFVAINGPPEHPGVAVALCGKARNAQATANAAFIVQACNSHDALVAALDATYAALDLASRGKP